MRGFRPIRSSVLTAAVALTAGLLGAVAATAPPAAAATTLAGYTAMVPTRICDTRASGPGVAANQCDTHGHSALSTGGVLTLTVAGAAGVPADATAVVLHVTATGTNTASFLTVWPTGQAQPTAANMNWTAGQTVPNLVQTGVGTGGQVSVFNYAGSVDVVVDLQGYFEAGTGGLYTPTTPTRVCDTRAGQPANPCNGGGNTPGTLGTATTRVVNVTSGFGVPEGATAVVLNVAATSTSAASYLTVWPDGTTQPLASSLNWAAGQTISNRVFTPISGAGNIDVFNAFGNADVVIDLDGYYSNSASGSGYFPITPTRICDTRPAGPGVASNPCDNQNLGPLPSGFFLSLPGFNPIVSALVANVTVTNTAAAGFMTVFPDDSQSIPLAADLTWSQNQTIGNLVVANPGSTSTIDLFNGSQGSTDLVIDVEGYYSATPPAAAAANTPSARRSLVTPSSSKRTAKAAKSANAAKSAKSAKSN